MRPLRACLQQTTQCFGKAEIALVENDFWNGLDKRTKKPRIKGHPSYERSWYDTYQCYFKSLPLDKVINWKDIEREIDSRNIGTNRYGESIRAFKKLARLAGNKPILKKLEKLRTVQTEFREQQEIDLETFMEWRDRVLGITVELHPNCRLDVRKKALWALGIQIVYGLRISEVFAIKNLDKPAYDDKGKLIVYAYNDTVNNPHRLIYLGKETNIGTTIKTGERLARPMIPPKYPNLYFDWDLQNPKLPENKPKKDSKANTIATFYPSLVGDWLRTWKAPFSQTHADRRLGNLLGMQAGISKEVRSKSLGHTPAMNDKHYQTGTIQTQIDILTQSNKQAIDFTSGLLEAKQIIKKYPNSSVAVVDLISKIYQKSEHEIEDLLN